MQIVAALAGPGPAQRRGPLGEAEQRTVLETITNLPADVIDQIVQPAGADGLPRPRDSAVLNPVPRTSRSLTSRPWEHDFPVPIHDVVATAALSRGRAPGGGQAPAQRRSRRAGTGGDLRPRQPQVRERQ